MTPLLVARGIYRSGCPVSVLEAQQRIPGLQTIICLEEWVDHYFDSERYATQLFEEEVDGVRLIKYPLPDIGWIYKSRLNMLLIGIFYFSRNGPLLFHCHLGKDRTGLVAAAVKIRSGQMTFWQAVRYAYATGFHWYYSLWFITLWRIRK